MTHLRTATVDRPGWISALHTSVASNRIVPALYGVASALDTPFLRSMVLLLRSIPLLLPGLLLSIVPLPMRSLLPAVMRVEL